MSSLPTSESRLAELLGQRLRAERETLTLRWLERIAARVAITQERIFPTEHLLDHVPILIDGIASYLEDPAAEITADMPVVAKAMELGELRHSQGFDAFEVMKEYEFLGGIIFNFALEELESSEQLYDRRDILSCSHRLFRAIAIIQQTTTTHFLRATQDRVREREERLRAFNRAISHEFKNRIGAVIGASQLIVELDSMPEEKRRSLLGVVSRNARMMQVTLENLLALSRLDGDTRQQRHLQLASAASEVVRQLRETAQGSLVSVTVEDSLPNVEVNAAAIELCLTNYVSNAIKYSDPEKGDRWVRVSGEIRENPERGERELVVRVSDNGLGVPVEAREKLFARFFRAHETPATHIEGTGLGLSIVRETIEMLDGRVWAEFSDEGTVFAFALPYRRGEDREDGGEKKRVTSNEKTSNEKTRNE